MLESLTVSLEILDGKIPESAINEFLIVICENECDATLLRLQEVSLISGKEITQDKIHIFRKGKWRELGKCQYSLCVEGFFRVHNYYDIIL